MFTCLYPWQYLHTHFVHQSLIWYNHILTYHYKITICIKKKSSSKNKWTRNNLYPYIWTHPFWHLWAFCFFCVLLSTKKPINFVLESNENSYQDWFQLAMWSQRRLKCESLWMTMVTMTDTKWWQYIAWPIESGELKRCWTWNKDKTMKLLHSSLIQETSQLNSVNWSEGGKKT